MDANAIRSAGTAALLTLIAFAAGLTLPDVDQSLGIGHRSGLTHSALPAALALTVERWRHAACGLAGGGGLHLAADCFPNAMTGYATVKLPFVGGIGAAASYGWLAANCVIALAIASLLLRRLHHPVAAWTVAGVAAVTGVGYLWRTDGGWPVLALIAAGGGGWAWRRRRLTRSRAAR